jgi:hypothetical protein
MSAQSCKYSSPIIFSSQSVRFDDPRVDLHRRYVITLAQTIVAHVIDFGVVFPAQR